MSSKELKKLGKEYHSEMRSLLNDWDVLGVMSHAPKDEYDGLNGKILGMLMDNLNKEKIILELKNELRDYYGVDDISNESIKKFTDKLIKWWSSKKK